MTDYTYPYPSPKYALRYKVVDPSTPEYDVLPEPPKLVVLKGVNGEYFLNGDGGDDPSTGYWAVNGAGGFYGNSDVAGHSVGTNGIALQAGSVATGVGNNSIRIGNGGDARGANVIVIGEGASTAFSFYGGIDNAIAIGNNAYSNSIAIGDGAQAYNFGLSIGDRAINKSTGLIIGADAYGNGAGSIAVGDRASSTGTNASLAVGSNAEATGNWGIAVGFQASVSSGIAMGYYATGDGLALGSSADSGDHGNNIAIGSGTNVTAGSISTIAIGATASGNVTNSSVIIGPLAYSNANETVAVGYQSRTESNYSIAIGRDAYAGVADNGIAMGNSSNVQAIDAIAIGNSATVPNGAGANNIAIGRSASINNIAAAVQGVAIGYYANVQTRAGVAIGEQTTANGSNSIAMGRNAATYGSGNISLGYGASSAPGAFADAIAIGTSASAGGDNAVAIGPNISAGADVARLGVAATYYIQVDANAVTDETNVSLRVNGGLKRLLVGATDSGGAGYRQVLVTN